MTKFNLHSKQTLESSAKRSKPRRRPSLNQIIVCSGLVLCLLFLAVPLWMGLAVKGRQISNADDIPKAECIMVLGARVYKDRPSHMLEGRLEAAISLYFKQKAPQILVSGGGAGTDFDEAIVMRRYLISRGVPTESIIMDHAGINTYQSCYNATFKFGYKKILIATTEYHMQRSLFLATKLGLDCYGYASPDKLAYGMPFNYGREALAKLKAIYNIYLHAPISAVQTD